jgi:hypothetical protein
MIWFIIGFLAGAAVGYFAHYKWGATLAADLSKATGGKL